MAENLVEHWDERWAGGTAVQSAERLDFVSVEQLAGYSAEQLDEM